MDAAAAFRRSPFKRRGLTLATTALLLPLAVACGGGEDQPTEPDRQVTEINLTPDRAALQPDSAVNFDAEAVDQSGNPISGVEFSWRVQDPTVATVNDRGLVRGLEAGETVVTAAAEGREGAAELKVRPGQTEVVDSTQFDLVSDSAERAQGTLRFEATGDAPAQDIDPGDILVGTEQGGFLRRATSVSRSGMQVVVETEQASLAEAADSLSFESTITLGTGATGQAVEKGNVQWGATYTRYAAPGVIAEEGALEINDLTLVSGEVCNSSGSNCADVSLVVPSGRVQFTPEMDVAIDIGFFELERFRAVGSGELTFDVSAKASASGKLQKTGEKELYQFSKPFYYPGPPPITGEVRLTFLAGYELATESQYSLETGFDSNYGVEVGATYEDDNWSEVFSVNTSFDPHPLESGLEGEVRSRVFVTSDVSVIFYTAAGPNLFVEPYLQGQATFAEECVLDLTAGMDAGLGFKVEILTHELAAFEKSLAIASSTLASSNLGCGGDLEISASTSGDDQDADGYTVTVDGSESAEIDPNGSTTFTDLSTGDHEVELSDIASNCSVDGENPRTVNIDAGETVNTEFSVSCNAQTGNLEASASTSGEDQDTDGYTVTVDGSESAEIDPNGSTTFTDLSTGDHEVELSDIASNCSVDGENARTVSVAAGETVTVDYEVECVENFRIEVVSAQTITLTGEIVDIDGDGEDGLRCYMSENSRSIEGRGGVPDAFGQLEEWTSKYYYDAQFSDHSNDSTRTDDQIEYFWNNNTKISRDEQASGGDWYHWFTNSTSSFSVIDRYEYTACNDKSCSRSERRTFELRLKCEPPSSASLLKNQEESAETQKGGGGGGGGT